MAGDEDALVYCTECGCECDEDETQDGMCYSCFDESQEEECYSCGATGEELCCGLCSECREVDEHEDYKPILKMMGRAFKKLEEEHGFVTDTEMCCSTCGSHACGIKMDEAKAKGTETKGAAFYHSQDRENLMESGSMYVGYFGADGEDQSTKDVGLTVTKVLESCGLTVEWDGNPGRRIKVSF